MLTPDKKPTPEEMAALIGVTAASLRFEMRRGALFAIEKSSHGEAMRVRSDSFEGFMYGRYKAYFVGAGRGDRHMSVMIAGIEKIARTELAAASPRAPALPRGGSQASVGGFPVARRLGHRAALARVLTCRLYAHQPVRMSATAIIASPTAVPNVTRRSPVSLCIYGPLCGLNVLM